MKNTANRSGIAVSLYRFLVVLQVAECYRNYNHYIPRMHVLNKYLKDKNDGTILIISLKPIFH
jgi:hypothetical protein